MESGRLMVCFMGITVWRIIFISGPRLRVLQIMRLQWLWAMIIIFKFGKSAI